MGAAERLSEFISEADYLRQERLAEVRHEYCRGDVIPIGSASFAHSLTSTNLLVALAARLKHRGWSVVAVNMRLYLPELAFFTYPDLAVVGAAAAFLDDERDTLLNPALLVEVLSPGTRAYDMGEKATRYRAIGSLQRYLMVDSTAVYAALLTRPERPGEWLLTETTDVTAILNLPALGCELPLPEVYEGVELGEQ